MFKIIGRYIFYTVKWDPKINIIWGLVSSIINFAKTTNSLYFPIARYHPDFGLFKFCFFHKLSPRSFDSVTLRSG